MKLSAVLGRLARGCSRYVAEYCRQATFQGLSHVVAARRHCLEVALWLLIILGAAVCSVRLIYRSWRRYQLDPIVVGLDKDHLAWNITFPGNTLCFVDKLDATRAKAVIKREWNVTDGPKFHFYMDFLRTVSNSSYQNLEDFAKFRGSPELSAVNLGHLMSEVNFNIIENYKTIRVISGFPDSYHETLTEMGICYSINSYTTPYLTPPGSSDVAGNRLGTAPDHPTCNALNLMCYAKTEVTRAVLAYVHSPFEVPDAASKFWVVKEMETLEAGFEFFAITTSPAVRPLKRSQRRCRFRGEAQSPESPLYSYQLCRMDCRRRLCMELCGCVPHLYTARSGQPTCDINGLLCLARNASYLIKLLDDKEKKYECSCLPSCTDTEYILYKKELHFEKRLGGRLPVGFRWKLDHYAKTRFRRDVIFGREELLVSWGGTAGLFLGCSILSFVELLYFFTLRGARCVLRHLLQPRGPRVRRGQRGWASRPASAPCPVSC